VSHPWLHSGVRACVAFTTTTANLPAVPSIKEFIGGATKEGRFINHLFILGRFFVSRFCQQNECFEWRWGEWGSGRAPQANNAYTA